MQFTIHPEHRRNKLLRSVMRALQANCPFLMGDWDGVLRYEEDLVFLDLHEHDEPETNDPNATWNAFGDRPAGIIAGIFIGQLWRRWEED